VPRRFRLSRWPARRSRDRDAVRDEPADGDDDHRPRCDGRRLEQPPPGLEQDISRDREQDQCVDDRGEDLEPIEAEAPAARRRTRGEPDRRQREAGPHDVGEHVPGVGQEREAVRGQADHDLGDEERARDPEHDDQPAPVRPRGAVGVRH